eukprot:gene19046-22792_t
MTVPSQVANQEISISIAENSTPVKLVSFTVNCQDPPSFVINSNTPLVLVNHRSSLRLTSVIKMLAITRYSPATCTTACFDCRLTPIRPYTGSYYLQLALLHDINCDTKSVTVTVSLSGKTTVSTVIPTPYDSYASLADCSIKATRMGPVVGTQLTRYYGDPTTVVYGIYATKVETRMCQMYTYLPTQPREIITDAMVPKYVGSMNNFGVFSYLATFPLTSSATYNVKINLDLPSGAPPQLAYSVSESLRPASGAISLVMGNQVTNVAYAQIIIDSTYITKAFWLNLPFANFQFANFYPFGFKSGRLLSYKHASNVPLSINHASFQATVTIQNSVSSPFTIGPGSGTVDTAPPFLDLLEIITSPSNPYSFTYRVTAGDLLSGIYSINITEPGDELGSRNVVIYEAHASSGNSKYGIFSIVVTLPAMVPFFPTQVSWSEINVLTIGFTSPTVDVSVGATNTMYLTLSQMDVRYTPKVKFHFFSIPHHNNRYEYILTFVPANNRYELTFTIPRGLSNDVVVFDLYADDIIPSSYFYANGFPLFTMTNSLAGVHMMGPILSNAQAKPSTTVAISADTEISWSLVIVCLSSGSQFCAPNFSGYVVIKGDLEPMSRNITIPTIPGTQLVFKAATTISKNCVSQTFRLNEIYLTDGVRESRSNTPGLPDPFLYVYAVTPVFTITTQCAASTDVTPPTLNSFTINYNYPTPMNVALLSDAARTILITAEVADPSGIKQISTPTVYAASLFGDMLQFPFKSVTCNAPANTVCTYSFTILIPYGWGSSDILLSLYGIVDNFDNFIGFTTSDLSGMGKTAIIFRTFDLTHHTFTDTNANTNRDAYANTIRDTNANTNANTIRDAYPNTIRDTNANTIRDTYPNPIRDTNANTNTIRDTNANAIRDTFPLANTFIYRVRNSIFYTLSINYANTNQSI